MKKLLLISLISVYSVLSFSQANTARLTVNADETLKPGVIETMTVKVENNSPSTFTTGKSEYALVIEYQGSSPAGQVFNQRIRLPRSIPAGESYTFSNISYKSPIYPGTYPVRISFQWGNRVISQVVTVNFEVETSYEAMIGAWKLSTAGEAETDIEIRVTNTGNTAWPDGATYSLRFELQRAPSAATRTDRDRFNITPRVLEKWDLEPGESESFYFRDFKLPLVTGDYVVEVQLLMNGSLFKASGATKTLTFKRR